MKKMDLTDTVEGFKHCLRGEQYKDSPCNGCPYDVYKLYCREFLYQDALNYLSSITTFKSDIYCSNCGEYLDNTDCYGNKFSLKYCPNCGRRIEYND